MAAIEVLPRKAAVPEAETFRPEITVATIVERDGRFLFVEERVRGKLVLNQPAGHWEAGESLFEAAIRETLEESAWDVELTGLVSIHHRVRSHDGQTVVRFTFAARAVGERVGAPLDRGIVRALWLAPREMSGFQLRNEIVRTSLEDYLKRPPMPLDVVSTGPQVESGA